jgi:hypothetical protein
MMDQVFEITSKMGSEKMESYSSAKSILLWGHIRDSRQRVRKRICWKWAAQLVHTKKAYIEKLNWKLYKIPEDGSPFPNEDFIYFEKNEN